MPTFTSQLGSQKAQQGLFQLGVAGDAAYTPPTMPTSARPWIAHLYNNDWSFRASLGAIIGQRPVLRQSLNSGFQPVSVELPTLNTTISPGNLIVITEEGGDATGTAPAGIPVIGGIIEQVPDTLDVSGWKHEITITPFVAELGDCFLNKNYSTATDVAQMVRDAIAQSNHLRVTPTSCPNTGITAIYNFSYAPCLEVLDHARLIAGTQYSWFVDAVGVVWFQAINTTGSAQFTVLPKDFSSLASNGGDISGLKNYCLVVGGIPSGSASPATATYTNPTSQATYGLRMVQPPITLPGVTDQTTLSNVAATVGGVFDRVIHNVTIDLPAYSQRILLGQPGGATMRYSSPSKYPLTESESGTGNYSATYVVLDVETDGIQQKVTLGDVPLTAVGDVSYMTERLVARTGGTGQIVQNPVIQPVSGGVIKTGTATLADSTGIVSSAVLTSLAVGFPGSVNPWTNTGSQYALIQGGGVTYTLSYTLTRAATVLLVANITASVTISAGSIQLQVGIATDTTSSPTIDPNASGMIFDSKNAGLTNATSLEVVSLPAGTHTLNILGASNAGTWSANFFNSALYVFLLGS